METKLKTYTKTVEETKPMLVIEYDEGAFSPRGDSNLGYFITQDRKYHSPDKEETLQSIIKETGDIANNQNEHIKLIKKQAKENNYNILAVYPVVKYEHSNISYSLGTMHGFDCSNNGFYIITKESAKGIGITKKDFKKVISQELETYTKYANGEVYGFTLYDKNGEFVDSCWGFYNIDDIKEHLPEEWKNEDLTNYLK